MKRDAITVATAYFKAWKARNVSALRGLLAENATFDGPLGRVENADDYAAGIQRLFAITTDVVVQKMIADDGDVITWFDLHTSVAPAIPIANWTRVEDGKIARVRVTFDPRALLAGQSS